jgi:hypothetical protein
MVLDGGEDDDLAALGEEFGDLVDDGDVFIRDWVHFQIRRKVTIYSEAESPCAKYVKGK